MSFHFSIRHEHASCFTSQYFKLFCNFIEINLILRGNLVPVEDVDPSLCRESVSESACNSLSVTRAALLAELLVTPARLPEPVVAKSSLESFIAFLVVLIVLTRTK